LLEETVVVLISFCSRKRDLGVCTVLWSNLHRMVQLWYC